MLESVMGKIGDSPFANLITVGPRGTRKGFPGVSGSSLYVGAWQLFAILKLVNFVGRIIQVYCPHVHLCMCNVILWMG